MNRKPTGPNRELIKATLIVCCWPLLASLTAASVFTAMTHFTAKYLYGPNNEFDSTAAVIMFIAFFSAGIWPTVQNFRDLRRGLEKLKEDEMTTDDQT